MGRSVAIRTDLHGVEVLRRLAGRERNRRAVLRLLGIANALSGMKRWEAAASAGMERQALCDAIKRYNAEGVAGLHDRPRPGRQPRLDDGEQARLAAVILKGPDPESGEPSAWTLPDLCRWIEDHFNKRLAPQSMSRVVRRLGFSRQKARPVHPKGDAKAQAAFKKRGSSRR